MIRAKRVYFQTSKTNLQRLFDCNRESAKVWNDCLRHAKAYHLQHNGKWINKSALQVLTKGSYHLHSQSIQAVFEKYLFARDATRAALLKGIKTAKYPYKQKKHYNTKWKKDGFSVKENGTIHLSMGIHNGKREQPIVVSVNPATLPEGKLKEIELAWDNGLYLAISYEDGEIPMRHTYTHSAGVDMGEIHSIAAFCETGEALIVTGRKIRSIHQLRNKKLGELQRLMSKCNKYSRQWKKYNRAKQFILSKSSKQLQDALHKTTKNFVDWCLENEVKQVFVGNPEGVQRRKQKKRTKHVNQKLSNWSFGTLRAYLEYKLHAKGILLFLVDEAYTSQTCPCCQRRKKVRTRNYVCACGYEEHRDIHGARNILAKELYGKMCHIPEETKRKYLRIA
ncbi:RNA-guided endonuclease InsQ/TnpB family protein [Ectobacillus panaciterrae]|uniref:RNA-guided endonuclease InsQ/TnpB family protein n=1 Tax=Ectobacillus panaciterrae TaxID=363872 RepID=UPI00040ED843|nr:RNA-guided endonuclease TnpB family protein [Ectobacillus panaciterrae]